MIFFMGDMFSVEVAGPVFLRRCRVRTPVEIRSERPSLRKLPVLVKETRIDNEARPLRARGSVEIDYSPIGQLRCLQRVRRVAAFTKGEAAVKDDVALRVE